MLPVGRDYFAIVSPEDYESLRKYCWHARKSKSKWYAIRKVRTKGHCKTIFMHREIMNCPPNMDVHHLNRVTFDNRRGNLLILSPKEHHEIHHYLEISRQNKPKTRGTPQESIPSPYP